MKVAVTLPLICSALLCGVSSAETQRVYQAKPLEPATVIREVPVAVPVPVQGQLMQIERNPGAKTTKKKGTPDDSEVSQKNLLTKGIEEATLRPDEERFFNSITIYDYMDGALYTVYTAKHNTTDIRLEPGEVLQGQPAAGDTVRWKVGRNVSGSGPERTEHVIVRPVFAGLKTNLTIYTDRRTYYVRLHSFEENYMASVAWTYPQAFPTAAPGLVSHEKKQTQDQELESIGFLDPEKLNFNYKIKNVDGKPVWKPERVFDNGYRTFIHFPEAVSTGELPMVYILTKSRKYELVNYRTVGRYFIIDRLLDELELRIGTKDDADVVRITREQ